MKIRNKFILIFIFISLMPVVFIAWLTFQTGKKALKEVIGQNLYNTAFNAMNSIDNLTYTKLRELQLWAKMELMQEVLTSDIDGRITNFLIASKRESTVYSNISCLNEAGVIVASSNLKELDRNASKQIWFKEALQGKTSVYSITESQFFAEPGIIFSAPIRAEFDYEKILGILVAEFNWFAMQKTINSWKMGTRAQDIKNHIMLLDKDHYIISSPLITEEDLKTSHSELLSAKLASEGKKGYLIETSEHNFVSLTGYISSNNFKSISKLGWLVLAMKEKEAAFKPVQLLLYRTLGFGAAFMIFSATIAIWLGEKVTHPIREIYGATRLIAHGRFEQKVNVQTKDELGYLANSFNVMTEQIKGLMEREKELAAESAAAQVERQKAKELEKAYTTLKKTHQMLIQSEKLAAVGRLGAGAAHELNNPLMGAIVLIEHIKDTIKETDAETASTLTLVENELKRCSRIVTDLLTFSRPEARIGEMIKINIIDVVEKTLDVIGYQLNKVNIKIMRDYQNDLPPVQGNFSQLEQVFLNLITNSRDAMPKGGTFKIEARLEREIIKISFSDTGEGISEKTISKIFEPFFTTKKVGKGTGLGLSVTKGIVESHKGRIEVTSTLGKGTTVTIFFPVSR